MKTESFASIFEDAPRTITPRQYLAGMAMQGLISKYNLKTPEDQQIIAQLSVELADTLIKELNS